MDTRRTKVAPARRLIAALPLLALAPAGCWAQSSLQPSAEPTTPPAVALYINNPCGLIDAAALARQVEPLLELPRDATPEDVANTQAVCASRFITDGFDPAGFGPTFDLTVYRYNTVEEAQACSSHVVPKEYRSFTFPGGTGNTRDFTYGTVLTGEACIANYYLGLSVIDIQVWNDDDSISFLTQAVARMLNG